ncbi:MAG: hypothetical protein AAGF89_05110 [Bacteroidota bacterium]
MKLLPYSLLPLLVICCYSTAVHAKIRVSNEKLEVGETVRLSFSAPVDSLTVTYRPSSSVSKQEFLVISPPASSTEWSPQNPGLVQLSYQDRSGTHPTTVSHNISVRFRGFSSSGVAVMLLAFIILFGGAGFAFRTLFQRQDT